MIIIIVRRIDFFYPGRKSKAGKNRLKFRFSGDIYFFEKGVIVFMKLNFTTKEEVI